MSELRSDIKGHFDAIAGRYDSYKQHSNYYYSQLKSLYEELIGVGSVESVLEIGCGTGDLLAHLHPFFGRGVDISEAMIEIANAKYGVGSAYRERFPHSILEFSVGDAETFRSERQFQFIFLADVIEHLYDPAKALKAIAPFLKPSGHLIISVANSRWEPLLMILEKLHMKMPEGPHNFLSTSGLNALLQSSGYALVDSGFRCLIPARVPYIADWVNERFHKNRRIEKWGLIQFFVCSLL